MDRVRPDAPIAVPSEGLDGVREAVFSTCWWRTVDEFAVGPESWGMADHGPVPDRLAKLKFNRLFLSFRPWQPFLDLEGRGIRGTSGMLWFGYEYPITEDMPGRHLFGEETTFWNPDPPFEIAGSLIFSR